MDAATEVVCFLLLRGRGSLRPGGIHAARNTLVNDASASLADPGMPGKEKPRARQLAAGFHRSGTAMRKVSARKLSSSIQRDGRAPVTRNVPQLRETFSCAPQLRETSLQLRGPGSAEFGAPFLFSRAEYAFVADPPRFGGRRFAIFGGPMGAAFPRTS